MLTLLVIAFSLLLSLAIRFLFGRRLRAKRRVTLGMCGVLIALTGSYLIVENMEPLEDQWARRSWPTTDGVVISSRIEGERAYRPAVTYHYRVNGVEYTATSDLTVPPFGGRRTRLQTAERILRTYPKGATVRTLYNPVRPEESMLRPALAFNTLTKIGLGATLLCGGMLLCLSLVGIGRR